jgi:hypothetical protein
MSTWFVRRERQGREYYYSITIPLVGLLFLAALLGGLLTPIVRWGLTISGLR